jgi:hypothetical protein
VLAVGFVANAATSFDGIAVKLAGADGSELWRRELAGSTPFTEFYFTANDRLPYLALGPAGDPFVAGQFDNVGSRSDLVAMRLSGLDGSTVWQTALNGTEGAGAIDYAGGITVDALGDPVVTGVLDNVGSEYDGVVVKLSGATGAEVWRRFVRGPDDARDIAQGVAVDGSGDVVVAATLEGGRRAVAAKLNADGSYDPALAEGKVFVLTDVPSDASRRQLKLVAAGGTIAPADPATPADPTVNGGELLVRNPTSGETMALALPAAGWTPRGVPAGTTGYVYTDRALALGACRAVKVRAGSVKASCRGAGLTFSLDEPAQGALDVRLRQGGPTGPLDTCLRFGGTVTRDVGASGGGAGAFVAKRAAPPAGCP